MFHDPHEPGSRIGLIAKKQGDEAFFGALNNILADAELPVTDGDCSSIPLVYVVGAPRTGTTLLYQLLCRYLSFGYINNLIARFWLRPAVGIRLSQALLRSDGRDRVALRSQHGTTEGAEGPHEFGYFWRHWLKLDESPTHHLDDGALQRIDRDGLKRILEQEVLGSFGCPVVFKNVICGFQANLLSQIHPASLFVHIVRDTGDTAASILSSRMERFGSYDTWWSLKPSTWPFTSVNSPVEEVVSQVLECRREFRAEFSRNTVHSLEISYEELCREPARIIDRIRHEVNVFGVCLPATGETVECLSPASTWRLPADMRDELIKVLGKTAA